MQRRVPAQTANAGRDGTAGNGIESLAQGVDLDLSTARAKPITTHALRSPLAIDHKADAAEDGDAQNSGNDNGSNGSRLHVGSAAGLGGARRRARRQFRDADHGRSKYGAADPNRFIGRRLLDAAGFEGHEGYMIVSRKTCVL